MQKVIVIKVNSSFKLPNEKYQELEFEQLQKYLEEGYEVKEFHQISDQKITSVIMTFILRK